MKEQILNHLDNGGVVALEFSKRVGGWDGKFFVDLRKEPGPLYSTLLSLDEIGIAFNMGWLNPKTVSTPWTNIQSIKYK